MRSRAGQVVSWDQVGHRYGEGRDCLASFLLYHSAEVLEGVKPGNLISLRQQVHRCGRNLYALWQQHGPQLLAEAGLSFRIMARRKGSLLLFLYRRDLICDLLARGSSRAILRRAGYAPDLPLEQTLDELQSRMGEDFPHEIGLFLGYPAKDVVGFMGWTELPCTGGALWKIYGDPTHSLELDACFRQCRCSMVQRLSGESYPLRLLKAA